MAEFLSDTLDFSAYMTQTDASVKVRKAALFAEDLVDSFVEHESEQRPVMFSTKLRHCIEFRPGEVTAWAGYNGHRKSTLTGQVALDLCVQRERVLMASFEMSPVRTLQRMAKQAFGVAKPAVDSLLAFSEWTDDRLWIFDHIGRISPDECIAVCRYFAQVCGGTQVVIDSMMMVCKSEEHLDEQKQFTTDLVRLAQETGLHVHLVAHCRKPQAGEEKPPTKYDLRGSAAISDQAHNVVTIWANKPKRQKLIENPHDMSAAAEPDAIVCVEKQRNGAWEGKVKLWFDQPSMRFLDERTTVTEPYALRSK